MPTYKDAKTNKWFCKFYYQDADGTRKQKFKRGFSLKRDADAWEREFLAALDKKTTDKALALLWPDFVDLYVKDVSPTLAKSSAETLFYKVKNHIRAAFDRPLAEITPAMIQTWANSLADRYSLTHAIGIYSTARAMFNYAERIYNLSPNPYKRVKAPTKREHKKEMQFWTLDEYTRVIACITDVKARAAITLLYWGGLRKGELLALTWGDLQENTLSITKSLQRIHGENVITPPKTPSSVRDILLPVQALDALNKWRALCPDAQGQSLIFPWGKKFIEKAMTEACEASGVKRIRVHDLRHSHASYLISRGANIKLVSQRLGHSKTSMTLDTYGHLYPSDAAELVSIMNNEKQS